jgi:hypothetical protein
MGKHILNIISMGEVMKDKMQLFYHIKNSALKQKMIKITKCEKQMQSTVHKKS